MEVKSLKMSDNMTYSDCIEAIIPPILELANTPEAESAALLAKNI
jgi:hypothetical protein